MVARGLGHLGTPRKCGNDRRAVPRLHTRYTAFIQSSAVADGTLLKACLC